MRVIPVLTRTARDQRAILVALGLLVFLSSFLATAAPRAQNAEYADSLRGTVANADPGRADVVVDLNTPSTVSLAGSELATTNALIVKGQHWRRTLPGRLREITGQEDTWARTDPNIMPGGGLRGLILGWSDSVHGRIRYVAGRPPGPREGHAEIALAAASAEKIRLGVGDTTKVFGLKVRVSGLYVPTDPSAPYWKPREGLRDVVVTGDSGAEVLNGTGLLTPDGYAALVRANNHIRVSWRYPVNPAPFIRTDASRVTSDLGKFRRATEVSEPGAIGSYEVNTTLDTLLRDFTSRLRTAQAVQALAFTGLLGVAAGVLALATRLILGRISATLATLRSRGASMLQLATGVPILFAFAAIPAAGLGIATALLLVDGPSSAWWLTAVLIIPAIAVLLPAAQTLREHRRPRVAMREDVTAQRPSPRRLMLEALTLALAIGGVVLIRRRGLTTEAAERGFDPLLSSVPVLLGLACALLVLRLYPYPLRLLGRAAARARSAAPFIGVARLSRQSLVTVLPLLVLILATSVAAFAATTDASLRTAQEETAWSRAGAHARIDETPLDAATIERVRKAPGVSGVVPTWVADGADLQDGQEKVVATVNVIAVDLRDYRRLASGTPLDVPFPAKGGDGKTGDVPALFSSNLPASEKFSVRAGTGAYSLPLRRAGNLSRFPAQAPGSTFVVIPRDSLLRIGTPHTGTMLIKGSGLEAGKLREAAGGGTVTTQADLHRELEDAPLNGLVRTTFLIAAVAVGVFAAITILLALISGARERGMTVAYLRTLGMSRSTARRLALVELAPMFALAVLTGWGLGAGMPAILRKSVDLRPYSGGAEVPVTIDPITTLLLAGGLLVFTTAAIVTDALLGKRKRLGSVLRIGGQT